MIRLQFQQFAKLSQTPLVGIYLFVGTDPLLISQSQELIRKTASIQGFNENNSIEISGTTLWQSIFEQIQSRGLFSTRQIFTLIFPDNPTALSLKNLAILVNQLHDDVLLFLQFPKLTPTMEKQDWFKQIQHHAPHCVRVNCQTPSIEQLPQWINLQAKQMHLTIDETALQLLCYHYENNLPALYQKLQFLALLYPKKQLNFQLVNAEIEDSGVFTVFQWIDALLTGKTTRAIHIFNGLQSEDTPLILLLRTVQKEIMTLLALTQSQKKENLDSKFPTAMLRQRFDELKIWQTRRPLYTQAIQRLTSKRLFHIIRQLAELERLIKEDSTTSPHILFTQLIRSFCE